MNKLKFYVLVANLLIMLPLCAQDQAEKDKINALKVAFITEKLNLKSKEAEAFWPLYNEYTDTRETLRHKQRQQVYSKLKDSETLSEAESSEILTIYLALEKDEETLDRKFVEKVSKVISAKKTLLLLRSEEEFKRQLIKQYRKKSGPGGYH